MENSETQNNNYVNYQAQSTENDLFKDIIESVKEARTEYINTLHGRRKNPKIMGEYIYEQKPLLTNEGIQFCIQMLDGILKKNAVVSNLSPEEIYTNMEFKLRSLHLALVYHPLWGCQDITSWAKIIGGFYDCAILTLKKTSTNNNTFESLISRIKQTFQMNNESWHPPNYQGGGKRY